jgi:RNA recognition motif-containing protein
MDIYIGNLSLNVTGDDLRQVFEAFGQVSSATILKERYSGQSRGFGFVEMPDQAEAKMAIKNLNGKEYIGRRIKVLEARPRPDQGRSKKQ